MCLNHFVINVFYWRVAETFTQFLWLNCLSGLFLVVIDSICVAAERWSGKHFLQSEREERNQKTVNCTTTTAIFIFLIEGIDAEPPKLGFALKKKTEWKFPLAQLRKDTKRETDEWREFVGVMVTDSPFSIPQSGEENHHDNDEL